MILNERLSCYHYYRTKGTSSIHPSTMNSKNRRNKNCGTLKKRRKKIFPWKHSNAFSSWEQRMSTLSSKNLFKVETIFIPFCTILSQTWMWKQEKDWKTLEETAVVKFTKPIVSMISNIFRCWFEAYFGTKVYLKTPASNFFLLFLVCHVKISKKSQPHPNANHRVNIFSSLPTEHVWHSAIYEDCFFFEEKR